MDRNEETYERRICRDCGLEYQIVRGEVDWYLSHNLSLPRRCKACRQELRLKQRAERERAREVSHD